MSKRCKYCDRVMRKPADEYAENPYCRDCLNERLQLAATQEFVKAFFGRWPRVARFKSIPVTSSPTTRYGTHPAGFDELKGEIQIFPAFWKLDDKTKDFVFLHEIGHYVSETRGHKQLVKDLLKRGVELQYSLPFEQANASEAFADCFATYFLFPNELHTRYREWELVIEELLT